MDPEQLLTDEALDAAVGALARRNHHHFEGMSDPERAEAVDTWRALALDVLTAVRSTVASEPEGVPTTSLGGRAVLVFEDAGEEDVAVHAAFHPELEEVGPEEFRGTAAQIVALSLIEHLNDPGAAPEG